MFMDFKYTQAASAEQHSALNCLHRLMLEWLVDQDLLLRCEEESSVDEVLLTVQGEM